MDRRRRKTRSKAMSEEIHFARRCIERIGYVPSQRQLIDMLRGGRLEFLKRQSNRITVWRKDDSVFVYDKARKTFVTALTYDMWMSGRVGVQ